MASHFWSFGNNFIIKLNTLNLFLSTLSIATSFFVASLTMLCSSYYALGYAANDLVLILLWTLASIENPVYVPFIANFIIFFINDIYGFISWKKRESLQSI
ncbi:MAG: nicotinamide mononucleotide transporter [Floccifex sp.]